MFIYIATAEYLLKHSGAQVVLLDMLNEYEMNTNVCLFDKYDIHTAFD